MTNASKDIKVRLEYEVGVAYELVISAEETRRAILTSLDDNIDHALVSNGPLRIITNVMLVESFKRHDLQYNTQKRIVELLNNGSDIYSIKGHLSLSDDNSEIQQLVSQLELLVRYVLRIISSTRSLIAEYIVSEHYLDPTFMSYFPDEKLLPHIEEVADSSPFDPSDYSLVSTTIH